MSAVVAGLLLRRLHHALNRSITEDGAMRFTGSGSTDIMDAPGTL